MLLRFALIVELGVVTREYTSTVEAIPTSSLNWSDVVQCVCGSWDALSSQKFPTRWTFGSYTWRSMVSAHMYPGKRSKESPTWARSLRNGLGAAAGYANDRVRPGAEYSLQYFDDSIIIEVSKLERQCPARNRQKNK